MMSLSASILEAFFYFLNIVIVFLKGHFLKN